MGRTFSGVGRADNVGHDRGAGLLLYFTAAVAFAGASLVVAGLFLLPEALRYRQRSGEGFMLFWAKVPIMAGGTAVLSA